MTKYYATNGTHSIVESEDGYEIERDSTASRVIATFETEALVQQAISSLGGDKLDCPITVRPMEL